MSQPDDQFSDIGDLDFSNLGKIDSNSKSALDLHKNRTSGASILFEDPFLKLCTIALSESASREEKDLALKVIREKLTLALPSSYAEILDIRLRLIAKYEALISPFSLEYFFSAEPETQRMFELEALTMSASASGDDFIFRLISYISDFSLLQAEFQKSILPKFKERFRADALDMIHQGSLPITIDHVDHVMQLTNIIVCDLVVFTGLGLPDAAGAHIFEDKTIALSRNDFSNYHVYAHEMMHALSGETSMLEECSFRETTWVSIRNIRKGVRYKVDLSARFDWLNEAITETLTLKLAGDGQDYAYRGERTLYDLILSKSGIDPSLFLDAYFENFDPSATGNERNPAWRKLYQAINQAFRPGFLLQLDKYISIHGLHAAVKAMHTDWRAIE